LDGAQLLVRIYPLVGDVFSRSMSALVKISGLVE